MLYDEFLNCNSYVYQMHDCENSSSMSSEAEFRQLKGAETKHETDEIFVKYVYQGLLQAKYDSRGENKKANSFFKSERYIDNELWQKAQQIVSTKAAQRKYLDKRIVADTGIVIPRWAS